MPASSAFTGARAEIIGMGLKGYASGTENGRLTMSSSKSVATVAPKVHFLKEPALDEFRLSILFLRSSLFT